MCKTGPATAGDPSADGLRLLADGIEALGLVRPSDRPGAAALELTAAVLAQLGRLQALSLSLVADVDARGLSELAGYPSTGGWLEAAKSPLDRSDVALARKYSRLPAVADSVGASRLTSRLGSLIGQAVDKVRPHLDRPDALIDGQDGQQVLLAVLVRGTAEVIAEARGGFEDGDPALPALLTELVGIWQTPASQLSRVERAMVLLAERAELEPALLGPALDKLVAALLPQQLADDAVRGHRSRGWRMQLKPDGSGWVLPRTEIDLELGELLHTVITAMRRTDPVNPADTDAWQTLHDAETTAATGEEQGGPFGLGLDPTTSLPRSQAQRDHDALALGLRTLLDSGALGMRGKGAPHLLITVPAEALHDQPGALPATGLTGTPLPASLVRRWLTDSRITRIVLSLGRKVIETSHTERTLKAHERLALHVQWGGRCAASGCTSPPGSRLVPHHANAWARTRTTSYLDSTPFCDTTHHDLHDGQHVLRLRDGRHLRPDGWTDPPGGPGTPGQAHPGPADDPGPEAALRPEAALQLESDLRSPGAEGTDPGRADAA